jgi:hypothetical protein
MKTFKLQNIVLAVIAAAGLVLPTVTLAEQDSTGNTAPPLAYGVPQILQLAQAKVTDDVIIAYIHNSGNSYGLNADQIIYLRQQGISDNVLTTMLNQPKPGSTSVPTAPPVDSYAAPAPVAYAQPAPAPAYDQSAPASSVYVMPNNQIYYSSYYPYYYGGYYPFVSFSYGWGGYNRGGCYYRGGYCNGYRGGYCYGNGFHSGNGFHGGVAVASRGGSFHGGVSFGGGFHGGGGGMMMHR